MGERKGLSKKTRFEVFKRDHFKCQYCGKNAPDVILEVDHIKPVSKGGTNGILNLITSCFDCNRGKGKRELKDKDLIDKTYSQLESLAIKREQIEMMMKWQEIETNYSFNEFKRYEDVLISDYDFYLEDQPDKAIAQTKRAIKKYGYDKFLEMTEKTAEKHFINNYDSINEEYFIQDIRKACFWEQKRTDEPLLYQIPYIAGILANRFPYVVINGCREHFGKERYKVDIKNILKVHSGDTDLLDGMAKNAKGCEDYHEFLSLYNFSIKTEGNDE